MNFPGIPVLGILAFITYILTAGSLSRIAVKEGIDDVNWFAWIPFLNIILVLMIVKRPMWNIIFLAVPVINVIFMYSIYNSLSVRGGKRGCLTPVLLILPVIGIFTWLSLARDYPERGGGFREQFDDEPSMFQ